MKIKSTITALALGSALAGAGEHRELRLEECPQAVQTTVKANARGGHIEEVDIVKIDGKETYIAEAELPDDQDLKIHVTAEGVLLKTREDIHLREAPEAVRSAVQGLGGSVDDVDKETAGQTVTYHIEIDRHGSPDLEVIVSAEGTILKQTEEAAH